MTNGSWHQTTLRSTQQQVMPATPVNASHKELFSQILVALRVRMISSLQGSKALYTTRRVFPQEATLFKRFVVVAEETATQQR